MPRPSLPVWLSAVCWLAVVGTPASAADLRGRVVGVNDGDTITVLDSGRQQHRIRLNGIDAPETGQPFSQVAKQNLSTLVFGQDVRVVWVKTDRYGRLVGTVWRGEINANLEQLRAGLAWFYRQYAGDVAGELRPLYEAVEAEARAARRGLWRDANPMAPWSYRAPAGGTSAIAAPSSSAPKSLGLLSGAGEIRGNRSSKVYHVSGCPNYDDIAQRNRVIFATESEAVAAGYRKAGNCRSARVGLDAENDALLVAGFADKSMGVGRVSRRRMPDSHRTVPYRG